VMKPGGICPMGGAACDIGVQIINDTPSNGKDAKVNYGPVTGGCGNCRFFCASPAQLFEQGFVINELMLKARNLGKEKSNIESVLSNLQWESENDKSIQLKITELNSQIENLDRHLEPVIREWYNRYRMFVETKSNLEKYKKFIEQKKKRHDKSIILLSSVSDDEIMNLAEIRLEKAGEFSLVRNILHSAQVLGGIEKVSELSKSKIRDFVNKIISKEDPRYLLVQIDDEEKQNQVAFLLAEAMSNMVGDMEVQEAIDNNRALNMNQERHIELHILAENLIKNTRTTNDESLHNMMPSRQIINDHNHRRKNNE